MAARHSIRWHVYNFSRAAACAVVLAGAARAQPYSPPADLLNAAKQEGVIEFTWPFFGGQPEIDALGEAFEKSYGFRPALKATPVTDIAAGVSKLIQELKAGRKSSTDFIVGSELHFMAMADADALDAPDWKAFRGFPADLVEVEGRGAPISTRLPGVTYNTAIIAPENAPTTIDQFIDSKYVVATTAHGGNFFVLGAREAWGPDRALDVARRLSQKAAGLINCGHSSRLLTGEFDMFGLDCGSFEALRQEARGAPLKSAILNDAAILTYLYAGVLRHAAHPAMARLFVAMLFNPLGQGVLRKHSYTDFFRLPDSTMAETIHAAEAKGVKFYDANYAWGRRNAAETAPLRAQFLAIFERK